MKTRNSNFELLRIFSMLMIIAHHYSIHGQFQISYGIHFSNMIVDFLYLGGKIGVILYVFITGYHMIHSKIKLEKLFRLELQVLFYSVLFAFLFYLFPNRFIGSLTIESLRQSFFPIVSYTYWFATVYMILYAFIPYINKLLLSLSQKDFLKLLLLGLILCTLIPTFYGTAMGIDVVIYFIFYYCIGAYFRLYPIFFKQKHLFLFSMGTYLSLFLTTVFFEFLSTYNAIYASFIYSFASLHNLFVLFLSISIFLFFKDLKIKNYKFINMIASTTFGIYLIHDNPYVRDFLWIVVFKNASYYQSPKLIIHALITILLVFIVASFIDFIRSFIFEKMVFPVLSKLCVKQTKN